MAENETNPPVTAPQSRRAALLFVGVLVAVLVVVGIVALISGGDEAEDEGEDVAATELACEPVPGDGGTEDCPSELITDPADVEVVTSEGDFTISLDTESSPATTTSFRTLAENGFYDGLTFHRVASGFVIQGGDPNGDGSGGPGYSVSEEVPPGTSYTPGVVAMAKTETEPGGTSGSQFFVVSGPSAAQSLTPDYAVVGEVSSGDETVAAIDALGQPNQEPTKTVTIESMTVAPAS